MTTLTIVTVRGLFLHQEEFYTTRCTGTKLTPTYITKLMFSLSPNMMEHRARVV